MGVDIPWSYFKDKVGNVESIATVLGTPQTRNIAPTPCTAAEHQEILRQINGKVIAIDASQWVFQANERSRVMAFTSGQHVNPGEEDVGIDRSILSLVYSKVHQLLAHGAHPVVVLDGRTPAAKDKCLAVRSGAEFDGRRAWTNPRFEAQKAMIREMIEAAGLPCVMAPGEGEAMCAALNAAGAVDAVVSTDVCDCFIFGATTVMRDIHLDFRKPPDCCLGYVRLEDVRARFGMQAGGRELVTALSMLIGTDYNNEGLRGVGVRQGEASLRALLAAFLAGGGLRSDAGFVEFVARRLEAAPDPAVAALKKCTGCLRCRHEGGLKGTRKAHGKEGCAECGTAGAGGGCHPHPDGAAAACSCAFHTRVGDREIETLKQRAAAWAAKEGTGQSFADHYRAVFREFEAEKRRADVAARGIAGESLLWRRRPDAVGLVRFFRQRGFSHEHKNGHDDIFSRAAKLELEWALRRGEGSRDRSFGIAAVKKVKEWPRKAGDDAALSLGGAWQFLVDLERVDHPAPPRSVPRPDDDAIWRECAQYDRQKAVKDAGMRVVRADVVRARWPRATAAFEAAAARAGKGAAARPSAALPGAPVPGAAAALPFPVVRGGRAPPARGTAPSLGEASAGSCPTPASVSGVRAVAAPTSPSEWGDTEPLRRPHTDRAESVTPSSPRTPSASAARPAAVDDGAAPGLMGRPRAAAAARQPAQKRASQQPKTAAASRPITAFFAACARPVTPESRGGSAAVGRGGGAPNDYRRGDVFVIVDEEDDRGNGAASQATANAGAAHSRTSPLAYAPSTPPRQTAAGAALTDGNVLAGRLRGGSCTAIDLTDDSPEQASGGLEMGGSEEGDVCLVTPQKREVSECGVVALGGYPDCSPAKQPRRNLTKIFESD